MLALIAACDRSTPALERARPAPIESAVSSAAPPGFFRAGDLEVLELVTGGADPSERLPLVVAVHGLGDRPESFASLFGQMPVPARVALPRAPDAHGGGYSWFSFSADMSADELGKGIERAAERLARAIDQIAEQRPTRGLPIVTGFSQGGMLSFAIAARHPASVRAAFPIGGRLPEALWPSARAEQAPRVVALHGEADARVPIAPAREAVSALRERGYDANLVAFPGVGHAVPPDMQRRLHALIAQELARP